MSIKKNAKKAKAAKKAVKTEQEKFSDLACKIKVKNRFWSRKEMPNDTRWFAHGHVSGNGDEVVSGPVYYTLRGCKTEAEASKLVEALQYEVDQDLAYLGGILDFLTLKRNSKFKANRS